MVPVPDIECPLSAHCLERLKELVDPLSDCSDYGILTLLPMSYLVCDSISPLTHLKTRLI